MNITEAVLTQVTRALRAHYQGKDLVSYDKLTEGLNKLSDAQFERVHREASKGIYN